MLLSAVAGQGGVKIPGAPGTLSLSAGSPNTTAINLSWSGPADDGGGTISGYRIKKNGSVLVASHSSTAYTATGLTGNTSYNFTIAAINEAGTGPDGNTPSLSTADPNPTVAYTGSPVQTDYSIGATNYRSLRFTGTGTMTVSANPSSTTFDILTIGGGGAGAGGNGGGGGAGGFLAITGRTATTGNTENISVGAGGVGAYNWNGPNGGATSCNASMFGQGTNVSSGGGGGGGGNPRAAGSNGASGGGGSNPQAWNAYNGGTGITGQGFRGGNTSGNGGYYYSGGGGGGAGCLPQDHGAVVTGHLSGQSTGVRVGSYGGGGKGSNYANGVTGTFDPYAAGTTAGLNSFCGGGGSGGWHYQYQRSGQFGGLVDPALSPGNPSNGSDYPRAGVNCLLREYGGWGAGNGSASNSGTGYGDYPGTHAVANSGSGGGAGNDASGNNGGNGGSGCVVIRWVRL